MSKTKKNAKKPNDGKAQNRLVVGGIIAIALMVVFVLVYVNNPMLFQNVEVVGPDPSIERGVTDSGFHYLGNMDAKLTVVLYEDFACPNCKRFLEVTEANLLSNYVATGDVRLEVHPIAIVSSQSLPAAEAVACAAEQGYFWEYRQVLFANQGSRAYNRDTFEIIADVIGLDVDDFLACYDQGRYSAEIQAQSQAAQQFGVFGTPTFEVAGERYPKAGETSLPNIFEILDQFLEERN